MATKAPAAKKTAKTKVPKVFAVGDRAIFKTRFREGRGVIQKIEARPNGSWATITPKGEATAVVRIQQLS